MYKICDDCKHRCFNYMVCEQGCYGSAQRCEHYVGEPDEEKYEEEEPAFDADNNQ